MYIIIILYKIILSFLKDVIFYKIIIRTTVWNATIGRELPYENGVISDCCGVVPHRVSKSKRTTVRSIMQHFRMPVRNATRTTNSKIGSSKRRKGEEMNLSVTHKIGNEIPFKNS